MCVSYRVGYSAPPSAFRHPSNSKPSPGKLTGDEPREKGLSACTFCGRSVKTASPHPARPLPDVATWEARRVELLPSRSVRRDSRTNFRPLGGQTAFRFGLYSGETSAGSQPEQVHGSWWKLDWLGEVAGSCGSWLQNDGVLLSSVRRCRLAFRKLRPRTSCPPVLSRRHPSVGLALFRKLRVGCGQGSGFFNTPFVCPSL
jgi:hypothetical protein